MYKTRWEDMMPPFILTFEVEENKVYTFQIFVQVRIIYLGVSGSSSYWEN